MHFPEFLSKKANTVFKFIWIKFSVDLKRFCWQKTRTFSYPIIMYSNCLKVSEGKRKEGGDGMLGERKRERERERERERQRERETERERESLFSQDKINGWEKM